MQHSACSIWPHSAVPALQKHQSLARHVGMQDLCHVRHVHVQRLICTCVDAPSPAAGGPCGQLQHAFYGQPATALKSQYHA